MRRLFTDEVAAVYSVEHAENQIDDAVERSFVDEGADSRDENVMEEASKTLPETQSVTAVSGKKLIRYVAVLEPDANVGFRGGCETFCVLPREKMPAGGFCGDFTADSVKVLTDTNN